MKNKDKMREIIAYLIFGVLTTAVGMGTYFVILWLGEHVWHISPETSIFNVVRVIAQILHWVFAVLFAFFTNKKWVFTNAEEAPSVMNQLLKFAASRLATLGLDTVITFGTVWLLEAIAYEAVRVAFVNVTADLISKIAAAIVVIITNYILSKIFVFKDKKSFADGKE